MFQNSYLLITWPKNTASPVLASLTSDLIVHALSSTSWFLILFKCEILSILRINHPQSPKVDLLSPCWQSMLHSHTYQYLQYVTTLLRTFIEILGKCFICPQLFSLAFSLQSLLLYICRLCQSTWNNLLPFLITQVGRFFLYNGHYGPAWKRE